MNRPGIKNYKPSKPYKRPSDITVPATDIPNTENIKIGPNGSPLIKKMVSMVIRTSQRNSYHQQRELLELPFFIDKILII